MEVEERTITTLTSSSFLQYTTEELNHCNDDGDRPVDSVGQAVASAENDVESCRPNVSRGARGYVLHARNDCMWEHQGRLMEHMSWMDDKRQSSTHLTPVYTRVRRFSVPRAALPTIM